MWRKHILKWIHLLKYCILFFGIWPGLFLCSCVQSSEKAPLVFGLLLFVSVPRNAYYSLSCTTWRLDCICLWGGGTSVFLDKGQEARPAQWCAEARGMMPVRSLPCCLPAPDAKASLPAHSLLANHGGDTIDLSHKPCLRAPAFKNRNNRKLRILKTEGSILRRFYFLD